MILEELTKDDVAICVNYVCDEYEKLGGDPKKVASKMEYAIEDEVGWKVVEDGTIVGFAVVEWRDVAVFVVSLVSTKSKASWLLFKKLLEVSEGDGMYIPIHPNMRKSKLCSDGVIDRNKAQKWVDKVSRRWEDGR